MRSAVFLLVLLGGVAPVAIHAQQPDASPASGNFMTPQTSQDQNLAAANQEDEDSVFKKSPTVRAVGHLLHLSPEHSAVLFEDFNFLILAVIIVFYAAKMLPKFFRSRQLKIDQQLLEARIATQEANERLHAVEERLGRLDSEIEELRTKAERDSAADEQRIKAAIEEERKKIVASTEHEIAALSTAAERSLRKFAAELAVARASARLHLTDEADRTLVRDFSASVADVQGRLN